MIHSFMVGYSSAKPMREMFRVRPTKYSSYDFDIHVHS